MKDGNHEQIFELSIKRKSLKGRLKECLVRYRQIVRLLRDWGREQEAKEADFKLREVCTFQSNRPILLAPCRRLRRRGKNGRSLIVAS